MKKIFLLFLTIANVATVFGATIEKDGIVIEYKLCDKYKAIKEDPYCIAIKNSSAHSIVVDEKLISAPLDSYEKLLQTINGKYKDMESNAFIFAFLTGGAAYASHYFYQTAQARARQMARLAARHPGTQITDENLDRPFARGMIGASVLSGVGAIIALWKAKQIWAIKNKLLHEEIEIQPGQSVEKIFWLKDPEAQFEINFDAVKVLK